MKDYLGHFSEESLSRFYDSYTRCERTDGSVYGTSGQCRKGKETGAKEEEPKKRGIVGRVKDKVKSAVRKVTGAEAREKKKAEEKAEQERKSARKQEAERKMSNTNDMAQRIKNDLPPGAEAKNVNGTLLVSTKTKSGHQIDYTLDRSGNVEFTVNGGFDTGTVKERKEQLEVALNVKRMHEAVVKNLRSGHKLHTIAHEEDGKGGARQKAYEAMGFSKPMGEEKTMVAVRGEDGKLSPGEMGIREAEALILGDQDFTEVSEEDKKSIKLWYQAIFGEELK